MKRRFTILTAAIALLVFMMPSMVAWGQEVTLDFTTNIWGFPTSKTVEEHSYTNNNFTITLAGSTGNGYQWYSNGNYLLNGKSGAYLRLPAFSFDVERIEVVGRSGASGSVKQNIFVGETEVSTETTGATGTNSYIIADNYQSAGNIYTLKVTSAHNTQITIINVYKKEGATPSTCATPTFSPAAGTYTQAQNVSISCATEGATIYYTTDGTNPDEESTEYTAPITVSQTTTIKAIAYVGDDASSVATATYTIVEPLTTMDAIFAAATEAGSAATPAVVIFNNWVVTGVTSSNAYVTDGTKGFIIYASSHGFEVGNVLSGTVACNVQLYKGAAEITSLTSTTTGLTVTIGGVVTPVTNISIANLSGVNTGAVFSYENLTYDGTNLVDIDDNAIKPFNSLYSYTFETNHVYNVTGIFVQYNSDKEILPRSADDIEEVTTTESSITINPTTVNVPFAATEGTLTVTYQNIEMELEPEVVWFEADGETTAEECDWILVEFDEDFNINYLIDANTGEARTAYMKVYGVDAELNDVYSELVTFSQGHYVADYATLPFAFDGGKADIDGTAGLTADGLGSDYNNSPKLKFDSTGDWVILHFNEAPGTLTFDIKGNSFSGSTFSVQTSEDGETYTDLDTYTELGNTQSEEFNNLGENVRYIKWIYTNKSSGNVALGNIALAKPDTAPVIIVTNDEIAVDANEHEGELEYEFVNFEPDPELIDIVYYDAEENQLEEDPDWILVEVIETDPETGSFGGFAYMIDANQGDSRTAYFKVYAIDDEGNDVYSNLVTVSQAAYVAPATGDEYILYAGELVEGDYVICYDNNTWTAAMKNTVDGGRLSYEEVVPNNSIVTTDDATIVWHIAKSGDYWTIYSANANAYAAGTGVKNKAQLLENGTDDLAMWSVEGTETFDFENKGNAEAGVNAMLRNNTTYGFACYAESTGGALSLYKKVVEPETYTLPITGYGSSAGGYYLIASPVASNVTPSTENGFLTEAYDLYEFNQSADNEWVNYEQHGFDLVNGKGYLYASQASTTLTFTGTPYKGDGEVELSYDENANLAGWNLIGNPFGSTATVDHDYYVMNVGGSNFMLTSKETPVAAMQGLFVVTESANDNKAIFTTEEPTASGEKLVMNVSRNRGIIDRAMIRFGEGHQMPKAMLNEDDTKIYIPQANNDYAVVRGDNEGEMPINFKAASNGTYTISIDADNVEMAYLHLFDNMTGADIDLLVTPSYSFEANTTDYASRFKLVYRNTTNVEENGESFAYFNGNEWVVSNEGDAQLHVIDMTGRIVSTETINGNATVKVNAAPGVYMLRLINGNDIKTQKVIIK